MGEIGKVFHVVPPQTSVETVQALEGLLADAKAGRLIGFAWIGLRNGLGYEIDLVGVAQSTPVFVRGLARVLDDQLAKIIGSR